MWDIIYTVQLPNLNLITMIVPHFPCRTEPITSFEESKLWWRLQWHPAFTDRARFLWLSISLNRNKKAKVVLVK